MIWQGESGVNETILIVDDDAAIGDMESILLQKEGYKVLRAYSGTEALLVLQAQKPDLVLLDLMLPGLSGEEVLKSIDGPAVIVISAKDSVDDKVSMLLGGAADYLAKPFDSKELLARIAVQVRKSRQASKSIMREGSLSLDEQARKACWNDEEIRLTRTEYAILKILMINAGSVISKSSMLDQISDDTLDCNEASLKVHVSNLRRKLKAAGAPDSLIEAVWGIGFIFTKA
jgi:two-component system OmpR family response regulator